MQALTVLLEVRVVVVVVIIVVLVRMVMMHLLFGNSKQKTSDHKQMQSDVDKGNMLIMTVVAASVHVVHSPTTPEPRKQHTADFCELTSQQTTQTFANALMKARLGRLHLAPDAPAVFAAVRRAEAVAPSIRPAKIPPSFLLTHPAVAPYQPSLIDIPPVTYKDRSTATHPFRRAWHLLGLAGTVKQPIDAASVLEGVHKSSLDGGFAGVGVTWDDQFVSALLRLPMSASTVVRLAKPTIACTEGLPPRRASAMLGRLTRLAAQHNALALIPALVDVFLDRMAREPEVGPKASLYMYADMVDAFGGFHLQAMQWGGSAWDGPGTSHKRRLPDAALEQLARITRDIIDRLDSAPSTSTMHAQITIADHKSLLKHLFRFDMMSRANMDVLLDYCARHNIELEHEHLTGCVRVMMSEGDGRAVDFMNRLSRLPPPSPSSTTEADTQRAAVSPTEDRQQANKMRRATHDIRLGRLATGLRATIDIIAPHLSSAQSPHDAWHLLAARSAADPAITADALLDLANAIPEHHVSALTLTPLMHGMLARHDARRALELWRDLVRRARHAAPGQQERYLDPAALTVGAQAVFRLRGLDAAVRLVDRFAARLSGFAGPARRRTRAVHSVRIDATCVNVLLSMCNSLARPGLAFRLWAAARPRWGVALDGVSLTLLLDTARFAATDGEDAETETIQSRLRMLADGFRLPSLSGHSDEDEVDAEAARAAPLATGSHDVLLDPPGYTWRAEHGKARPWEKAAALFCRIVLGNWPALQNVQSPLDAPGFALRSLASLFLASNPSDPLRPATRGSAAADALAREPLLVTPPLPTAPHLALVPTPGAWQAYISLLTAHGRQGDVPIALAWMRHLDVVPTRKCLTTALLALEETAGPARRIGEDGAKMTLMRDDEVLGRWLVLWLGEEHVPSAADIAAHYHDVRERRQMRREAWEAREERQG